MTFQHLLLIGSATLFVIGGNGRAFGECGVEAWVELVQQTNAIEDIPVPSDRANDHQDNIAKAASALAALWAWTISTSSYDMPEACPRIEFRPAKRLPGDLCPPGTYHCGVGGYYRDGSGTIIMRNDHDLDDVRVRAILAHELVHYLQDQSGIWREKSCQNKILREREAYDLQQRYLIAHHGNPFGIRMPVLDETLCSKRTD